MTILCNPSEEPRRCLILSVNIRGIGLELEADKLYNSNRVVRGEALRFRAWELHTRKRGIGISFVLGIIHQDTILVVRREFFQPRRRCELYWGYTVSSGSHSTDTFHNSTDVTGDELQYGPSNEKHMARIGTKA